MLVLTRRADQKVVFPNVGITLEVLRVKGNVVKLGIDAPEHVKILRHEVHQARESMQAGIDAGPAIEARKMSRKQFHELRNQLNSAKLAAHLLKVQIDQGHVGEEVEDSLQILVQELTKLEDKFGILNERDRRSFRKGKVEVPHPYRALIVEDDSNELKLMAGILRMSGFDVMTAEDGAVALDLLKQQEANPDVVIVDMAMPKIDGAQTVRAIRQNAEWPIKRIYAVSGAEPDDYNVAIGESGVDHWFLKPLDPEQLVRRIYQDVPAPTAVSPA